jgi:hypothetical protein
LGEDPKLIRDLETARYSFINPEFINPRILDDLTGWISDLGDQVVSINISDSNKSNRYFGDVTVEEISNSYPMVKASFEDGWVSYRYVGQSFSGVHIVQTWSNGGGSGIFCNILLVTLSSDFSIEANETNYEKRTRYVIKLIGSLALGDRYEGEISYKYGFLSIPACKGIKSLRENKSRVLIL